MQKVSILIPVFNSAAFLDELLASVLVQTYSNWEVILVDDHSTDSSWIILQNWALRDKRIRIFQRPAHWTKGANSCRNWAKNHAAGELILFFDSDDVLAPDKIAIQVDALQNPDLDFCVGTHWDFSSRIDEAISMDEKGNATSAFHVSNYLTGKVYWITGDVMYKANSLTNLQFDPSLTSGQEYHFNIGYLMQNPQGVYVPQARFFRRIHSQSIQQSLKSDTIRHLQARFDKHRDVWQAYGQQLSPEAKGYLQFKLWEFYFKLVPNDIGFSFQDMIKLTNVNWTTSQKRLFQFMHFLINQTGKGRTWTVKRARKSILS